MVLDYGINSIRGGNTQTLKGVFFARLECIPRVALPSQDYVI